MFSTKRKIGGVVAMIVLVVAGCGQNTQTTISFGPWSIALEEVYTNQYVQAADVGNAVDKVLAFRQEESDEQAILDTLLVLQINQYFDSQQQFKDAFVKNYISLVGFEVIQDQNINLDCGNQKSAMFQFAYSDNPVENSLLYVTQLYLLDTDQKQSYMLSHVTQQKKDAKALINQMKGIACSQTS